MTKIFSLLIVGVIFAIEKTTPAFSNSILKCDGGYLSMIDNGNVTKGQREIVIYFAYSEDVFAMFFSPKKDDPRDLFVKREWRVGHIQMDCEPSIQS
jgi:hypothetical protein